MPRAVGVFVFVRKDLEGPLLAVLHRRGTQNFERGLEPESFPYGFQPTCHGSMKVGESPRAALQRTGLEEIGFDFADFAQRFPSRKLTVLTPESGNAIIYGVVLPFSCIQNFRLHSSSGGLAVMNCSTFRQVMNRVPFERRREFPSAEKCGMVDDEYDALLRGFEEFSGQS